MSNTGISTEHMRDPIGDSVDRGAWKGALKAAFPYTIPILAGFILLGITCGIYSVSLGLPWWTPTLMATIIFAGSAEFVVASMLTGALPFLAFPEGRETPRFVRFLGDALPGAVFALLVVYCLREVDPLGASHGIPEALGILVAGGTYLWRRNMLLSIFASTALYMVLVNLVFV